MSSTPSQAEPGSADSRGAVRPPGPPGRSPSELQPGQPRSGLPLGRSASGREQHERATSPYELFPPRPDDPGERPAEHASRRIQAEIRALERVAYDLWVAPETEELDGWILRAAAGLTGRANSVWPNAHGSLPLADKIAAAEAWYDARGLPPRFQVTAAALPGGLEAALAGLGYRRSGETTSVETARLPESGPHARVELTDEPDDRWIELWQGARGFARPDVARALLTGSPGRTVFARVGDEAVGRGVAVDDWLGVTSMATVPSARRRGHARAVLETLCAWARALGCTRALLQVESGNAAARALYRGYGFAEHHAYRYLAAA